MHGWLARHRRLTRRAVRAGVHTRLQEASVVVLHINDALGRVDHRHPTDRFRSLATGTVRGWPMGARRDPGTWCKWLQVQWHGVRRNLALPAAVGCRVLHNYTVCQVHGGGGTIPRETKWFRPESAAGPDGATTGVSAGLCGMSSSEVSSLVLSRLMLISDWRGIKSADVRHLWLTRVDGSAAPQCL